MSTPYNSDNETTPDNAFGADTHTPASTADDTAAAGGTESTTSLGTSDYTGTYGSYGSYGVATGTENAGSTPNADTAASAGTADSTDSDTQSDSTTWGAPTYTSGTYGTYGSTSYSSTGAYGDPAATGTHNFGAYDPATPQTAQTAQNPQQPQPNYAAAQQGAPAGYPAQYAYPAGVYPGQQPVAGGQMPQKKSFFSSLFDFSFRNFITDDFAKALYIIHIVTQIVIWVTGLMATIFGTVATFGVGVFSVIGWLIFGTLWTLLNIIIGRVTLEFVISIVRLYQNSEKLVEQGERK